MHTPTITPLRPWPYTAEQHEPALPQPPTGMARLTAAVLRWYRMRRDARRLMAFDDRLLQDIGLSRGEIDSAVQTGRDWF